MEVGNEMGRRYTESSCVENVGMKNGVLRMNLSENSDAIRGTLMAELPLLERPRERLLRYGSQVLTNAELIALVIGTGRVGESALSLAERILAKSGGLVELVQAEVNELQQVDGVGPAKAATILAAIELGRRLQASKNTVLRKIASPSDAAGFLLERLAFLRKEHFMTLHLDTKHQIIGEEIVSIGSLNASIVHPREIFKIAVKRSAAAIICSHNHPSGDPTPSSEDIAVTNRLIQAGNILGIDVLDHIVVGDARYVSMRECGYMGNDKER